uniref:non-specific serine/threonine protein kinase n=1 Tax=Blastobotrys adeninivorans TaxID=409370 RepID=A0A060TA49_BLAAD
MAPIRNDPGGITILYHVTRPTYGSRPSSNLQSLNLALTMRFRREEVIGRGNFGVVYKGVDLEARRVVAIKVLDLDTAEDDLLDIQHEINTLSNLTQSEAVNIIKYYGSYLYGTKLWIIMDLCAGGSVRTLLKAGRFEERYTAVIMREVLLALSYIHKEGIIHRDIKAANILVTNDGRVRLCDFGVAAQVSSNKIKRSTIVGTPYWMAPEVITEGAMYNTKADIWSLGVTVYEIATGNPPYADQDAFRAIMLIPRQKPARLEGSQYSAALKEFVAHCLDEHPEERSSADELAKLKFIKSSRSYPTAILQDLVQRYKGWREKSNVRDSVAMLKGIKIDDGMDPAAAGGGRRASDVSSIYSASSEGSDLWDFDTSDLASVDYSPDTESTLDATGGYPQSNSVNGLGFSYPQNTGAFDPGYISRDGTVREAMPDSAQGPKSLLELFDDGDNSNASSGPGPSMPMSMQMPMGIPGGNSSGPGDVTPVAEAFPPTPTVEIEIPSFDAMEEETRAAASAANTIKTPSQPPPPIPARSRSNTLRSQPITAQPAIPSALSQSLSQQTQSQPPQPPQPPQSSQPPQPPQPSQPLSQAPQPQSQQPQTQQHPALNQHGLQSQPSLASQSQFSNATAPPPPPPSAPPAVPSATSPGAPPSGSSASPIGSTASAPLQSPASPAMQPLASQAHPHLSSKLSTVSSASSARRTPSPKRMTPKGSPPKSSIGAPAMAPIPHIPRRRLGSEDDDDKRLALKNRKPPALIRKQKFHITMPPSSMPVSTTAEDPLSAYSTDELAFPAMPRFDPNVMLDTVPKQDVVAHLDYMLDSFDRALTTMEEGLHSIIS